MYSKRLFKTSPIIKLLLAILIISNKIYSQNLPAAYAPGTLVNYVRTWDAVAPEQNPNALMTRPLKDVKQTTQYIEGLGRPIQTVAKKGSLITDPSNPTLSTNAIDIVTSNVYDEFNREQYKYLPFAANNTGGNTSLADGNFKLNPFQQQKVFYDDANGILKAQGETFFYSQTTFEASPLNRPEKTMAPGNSWVGNPGTPRGVETKYWINTVTDNVRIWNVAVGTIGSFSTYSSPGIYPAGQLYKNETVDETGNQVIEFKDKEGKVVLKKVQLTATVADNGTGKNHAGWLCTYYLYDDLNNLRCVMQPRAIELINIDSWAAATVYNLTDATILAEQCFRYEYDQRNRMIIKKVPGAGDEFMVYDTRDRLVATSTAVSRAATYTGYCYWNFILYDEINRPIATGEMHTCLNLTGMINYVNGLNNGNVTFNTQPGVAVALTAWNPVVGNSICIYCSSWYINTITHYDDYAGLPAGLSDFLTTWNSSYFSPTDNVAWPYPQMPTKSTSNKGMPTWTSTRVLGTGTFLNAVTYFDDKGRVIQVQNTNITNGLDVSTTQYTWAGQPLISVQRHQITGVNAQENIVVSKMTYDDLGRIVKIEKKIGNSVLNTITGLPAANFVVTSETTYDALGQLKTKKIGKKKDVNGNYTATELETLTYDYNIRGWILGVNRGFTRDDNNNNYFGFDLGYDKQSNNLIGAKAYSKAQFNGNIAGMVWKSKGDGEKRKYDFDYDAANRLLKADFTQYTGGDFNQNAGINYNVKMGDGINGTSAYDANGNIKAMTQFGLRIGASPLMPIDNLTYNYMASSNKLLAVSEDLAIGTTDNKLGDFTDKNRTADDYDYDVNGNLKYDKNKTISSISYNHLNLPWVVTVTGKGTVTYTYDAAGNKLRKTTQENNVSVTNNGTTASNTITTTTDYISGFVYESKTYSIATGLNYTRKLQFTGHEEGRIRALYRSTATPNTITGLEYDYMIKDHLGNVRMVLTEEVQEDIYPILSFEGASGSAEVKNQNDYWEKADGTPFDVIGKRTTIQQLVQATTLVPPTLTNSLLVRSSTGKVGAGKLLKVMAGDRINTTVQYYYSTNSNSGTASSLSTLATALSTVLNNSVAVAGGVKGNGAAVSSVVNSDVNAISFFSPQNSGPTGNGRPKAFLNVIFFDEQFKFDNINSYSEQVGTINPGQVVIALSAAKEAKKNGYCYIYISNESDDIVYFDNFTLKHEKGQVLEETHYYPFGLTMAGISSKAAGRLENKYKYNKGSELQSKEFSDGSGLEMYDTHLRQLDHQLGRWWQIDPKPDYAQSLYSAMGNNPIKFNDPLGDTIVILNAPKGAGGAGHMAILIQNKDGKYALWSKNGTNQSSGSAGPNDKGDDKGTATFNSPAEFMKSNKNPVTDEKTGEREYTQGFKINTTAKQDRGAEAGASKELKKDYGVLGSNCATMVQSSLTGAGQKNGSPSTTEIIKNWIISPIVGTTNQKMPNVVYDRVIMQNEGEYVF